MNSNSSTALKLPFWMKMFSADNQSNLDESEDTITDAKTSALSKDSMTTIAKLLAKEKSVVLMSNGQPIKVFIENGKVKIVPIKDPEYS